MLLDITPTEIKNTLPTLLPDSLPMRHLTCEPKTQRTGHGMARHSRSAAPRVGTGRVERPQRDSTFLEFSLELLLLYSHAASAISRQHADPLLHSGPLAIPSVSILDTSSTPTSYTAATSAYVYTGDAATHARALCYQTLPQLLLRERATAG